jgi:hypothetical protein
VYPKLNPSRVNDTPPVTALFIEAFVDSTGASYVNDFSSVPTTELSVNATDAAAGVAYRCGRRQRIIVVDVQELVVQTQEPRDIDGDRLFDPKLNPNSVSEPPAEEA